MKPVIHFSRSTESYGFTELKPEQVIEYPNAIYVIEDDMSIITQYDKDYTQEILKAIELHYELHYKNKTAIVDKILSS